MKTTKKIISLLLAAIMLFALCAPAFAGEVQDEKPFENSEYFTYEDLTIHYRVFKAENEKAKIFMIHGFALSSYCWEELATRLCAEGYTCVAADLPDFGYSSRETAESTLYPREDIMHALMMSISDEQWYVAGHSMGGYITLALAEKYPESVKNILLYGTACNTGVPEFVNVMMKSETLAPIMAKFMECFAHFDFIVKAFLKMGLCDDEYAENYDLSKITKPLRISGTGMGAIYSFTMLPETNLEAVEKMPPILYINGDKDFVIQESARETLREHLPGGSVDMKISGGGHMFIENYADETAKATLDFLDKVQ